MLKRLGSLFAVTSVALLALASPVGAATITPNIFTDELNSANANCSLREALSIANTDATTAEPDCAITNGGLGDDTISLGAGNYVLDIVGTGEDANANGDLDVISAGGDLTIDGIGSAVATPTTIDTDDSPPWAERVLHQVTSGSPLVVSDLVISGGNESSLGGGIRSSLSSGGSLAVQGVRVTSNDAVNTGGGLYVDGGATGSLSILDSVVDDNSSAGPPGGGGVFTGVPTTIDSSVITGNDATRSGARGGGILLNGAGLVSTITDSVIEGNTAESTDTVQPAGGGISAESVSVTIRGTTFTGNKVVGGTTRVGGGMSMSGSGTVANVVNSTFSGNEALGAGGIGGGLRTCCTATVVHSTFGPNPVGGVFGSALQRNSGTLNIRGSVVETSGAASACAPGAGFITSQGFNVFTDSSCANPLGTGDEADADPLLGALEDNGGPGAGRPDALVAILTHLPAQASTVVDHVPAADCDDEIAGAPLLLVDQRGLGFPRPFDGDGNGTADCDAGSVELQTQPTTPPPPPPPPAGGGQPTTQQPTTQQPPATPVAKKKCKKSKKRAAAAKKKCKKKHKK
jgi:hypothetical protein